jgi:transcription elongation factor Elf1
MSPFLSSERWIWTAGTPKPLRETLRWQMTCPAGCDAGTLRGGTVTIERSNPRSVTLVCKRCGLHWTMTLHQLAKAAQHWDWHPLLGEEAASEGPKYLAELAAELPQRRGRKADD